MVKESEQVIDLQLVGATVAIIVTLVGGTVAHEARYPKYAEVPSIEAFESQQVRNDQLHTQLTLMLMEERVRRYRDEADSATNADTKRQMKRIAEQIVSLEEQFREKMGATL